MPLISNTFQEPPDGQDQLKRRLQMMEHCARNLQQDEEQSVHSDKNPRESVQECDGWELHKKTRFNLSPVKRYQSLVQEDYTRNKILVCANLSNLWHSYQTRQLFNPHTMQMATTSRQLDNYFNLDKWC